MDFSGRHVALWWGLVVCWGLAAVAWVWFSTVGCSVFFFFFLGVNGRLWVAGGGVSCV